MFTRIIQHARNNAIAYLALFVALGGTSYAAYSLPRNSVGAAQIRNHSITAVKLNQKSIAASVTAWVKLRFRGGHLVATAASQHVVVRSSSSAVSVVWPRHRFAATCAVAATPVAQVVDGQLGGFVTTSFDPTNPSGANLTLLGFTAAGAPAAQAADAIVLCP